LELSHNALDGRGGQHLGNILRYNNVDERGIIIFDSIQFLIYLF